MYFEGIVIEINSFRKTNCTRIFYAHVIFNASAGNSAKYLSITSCTVQTGSNNMIHHKLARMQRYK